MSHLVEEALNLGASLMEGPMRFSDERNAELRKPLDRSHVKQRPGPAGRKLSYVEGYIAIRIANEVFGFDGWSYEVKHIEPVDGGVIAYVRLRVGDVFREDVGFGDGNAELAYKEAVTDALKRALRTFGDRFGLDLYDKDSELHKPEAQKRAAPAATPALGLCPKHNVVWQQGRSGIGHMVDGQPNPCLRAELEDGVAQ